jgi:hypothetical protein
MRLRGLTQIVLIIGMIAFPVEIAHAGGDVTEKDMTEKDFKEITKTESSDPAQAKPEPVEAVHDFGPFGTVVVKESHGLKVVKGKDWKTLSPKERDKRLRKLKETAAPGAVLVIEVPSGNVWLIDEKTYTKLKRDKDIREWTDEEKAAMPKAVKADTSGPHQDTRNGGPIDLFRDFGAVP